MISKKWLVSFSLLLSLPGWAQIGGKETSHFLNLPANAKEAALGGINISAPEQEVSSLQTNPAFLKANMHQQVSFGFTDFLADVAQSNLTYALNTKKAGLWGLGISYVNYGDFTQRDATGLAEGEFSVQDYAVGITHATTLNHFTLGATVKVVVSSIAEYKAVAVATDWGGAFKHPEKDLSIALAFKNIGYQLQSFTGDNQDILPFDAQLGFSYKPEHMPFRFSLTAHHLQKLNIVYQDTTVNTGFGTGAASPKVSLGDKIARHFVVGGEVLLSKNFNLRFGYNHLRRKELKMENASGTAGFSVGTLVRIKGFQLDYARAYYYLGGATNYFTLSSDLQQFFKKNKAPVNG